MTGTAALLRASLRHDGRRLAPWVVIATGLSASSVLVYPYVFPSAADRAGLAAAVGGNPALGLIFGPAFDLSSVDGFNAWRSLALGGFLAALGAVSTVVRATRAQEDSGQAELLASAVVGRSARLAAGIGQALLGCLAVGVIAGVVTAVCGGGWGPSLLLGATFTATGWIFTGVAGVSAQLASEARTASSLAVGTLGVLFGLLGVAYSLDTPAWTRWVNPLAWMIETRPASGDRWWPLALAVVLNAVLIAAAFVLQARRDFGQGAIATRPGPERGRVRSTASLAWRLNRGPAITWLLAFAAIGVVFGYLTTSVTDILGSNSAVQQVLAAGASTPQALVGAFLVTILSLVGIICGIAGVQVLLRLRAEEVEDRVEPLVAAGASRLRTYASSVGIALALSTACVLLAGVILSAIAAGADIGVSFGDGVLQSVAVLPAVWAVVAVAVAVVGVRPAASLAAWLGVLVSFVLTLLGPTFGLPEWALDISPFHHVPAVTSSGSGSGWALLWVGLVAAALVASGLAGFSRRDLAR